MPIANRIKCSASGGIGVSSVDKLNKNLDSNFSSQKQIYRNSLSQSLIYTQTKLDYLASCENTKGKEITMQYATLEIV